MFYTSAVLIKYIIYDLKVPLYYLQLYRYSNTQCYTVTCGLKNRTYNQFKFPWTPGKRNALLRDLSVILNCTIRGLITYFINFKLVVYNFYINVIQN